MFLSADNMTDFHNRYRKHVPETNRNDVSYAGTRSQRKRDHRQWQLGAWVGECPHQQQR